jgi:hypothetical protein
MVVVMHHVVVMAHHVVVAMVHRLRRSHAGGHRENDARGERQGDEFQGFAPRAFNPSPESLFGVAATVALGPVAEKLPAAGTAWREARPEARRQARALDVPPPRGDLS